MHFYRAMSLDEYKKFLEGEEIRVLEDKWKTGRICMMPTLACLGEKEIVESLYRVYPNMAGIVNPEVFVKFEVNSDKLQEMINNEEARFAKTKYDTIESIYELQMDYYNGSFCTPQAIAFAADSFISSPIEKINWYTDSQVTLANIDFLYAQEFAVNKYGGYNIDYKTDTLFCMSGNTLSPKYLDYQFAWVYANRSVDLSPLWDEIIDYNSKNGNVFEKYAGGITFSFDYCPMQSINCPAELNSEFLIASRELKDLTYFQHSKNFMEIFSKVTGTEIPEDLKNMMDAMESGLSSPYRYSININGENKDIMYLRFVEGNLFRAENIIASDSASTPTWKILDKTTGETYYADTETLIDKCNISEVYKFVYDKEIFASSSLGFLREVKDIASFEEFEEKSKIAGRKFGQEGLDDVYNKLFARCESISSDDLFLGYVNHKSEGIKIPIVCFSNGKYILGIDSISNPENICVIKSNGDGLMNIPLDGCSFEDAIEAVTSVAGNQRAQYWEYISIIRESLDSVRQIEAVPTEKSIREERHLGVCGGYRILINVPNDIFSANTKDSYITSNAFEYNGLKFSFDFIDGIKFSSDEYECTIKSLKNGYELKISSETIEFIDEYSSVRDAINKISEICCSEYNLHIEEYPALSQLDYSGKIFERVFSSDIGVYTEGPDFASFDFGNGTSMTIDQQKFIFYKEESGEKVEFERIDIEETRDYDKAVKVFDSVMEEIKESHIDFELEM